MADPITLALLGKAAAGIGGKMAVKAVMLSKLAGLKAFLAHYMGAQAASVSTSVLAAGAAAAYWELNVRGNDEYDAREAAIAKGMSEEVARLTVEWLLS